jgi:hypothetical protein
MVTTIQERHTMERRLGEIGRRIDALMSAAGQTDGIKARIDQEVDTWRRWRDELQVQAELGAMDARYALEPKMAKIEVAFENALARIEELVSVPDLVGDDIYAAVSLEMSGLRREIDNAGADFDITE